MPRVLATVPFDPQKWESLIKIFMSLLYGKNEDEEIFRSCEVCDGTSVKDMLRANNYLMVL